MQTALVIVPAVYAFASVAFFYVPLSVFQHKLIIFIFRYIHDPSLNFRKICVLSNSISMY